MRARSRASNAAACAGFGGYDAALEAIGYADEVSEVFTVFVGNNLPQMDVNALVLPDNADGIVAEVHALLLQSARARVSSPRHRDA